MLRRARPEKRTTRRVAAFAALSLGMTITGSPGAGEREIDLVALIHLVHDGQGAQALERVADLAASRGGWAPAPGDLVVFDPGLPWWVRGSVLTADLPPADCAIPRFSQSERCVPINAEIERQVRFGQALFMDHCGTDSPVPRPSLDDVLATFCEEAAHSWQEYFYETEGRGCGERTRQTGWEEAGRWIHGREYQVKVYVLSLTDYLPDLSTEERSRLYAAICAPDGYACPLGHPVPSDGPPPGWPNPDGWPVSAPSPEELAQFCQEG